jgi:hypothetical protein
MTDLDAILPQLAEGHWPRPTAELGRAIVERLRSLEAENERVFRGMVWAHYELAVADEPDTLWLMDLLAGLLDGKTADEAAAVARSRDLATAAAGEARVIDWKAAARHYRSLYHMAVERDCQHVEQWKAIRSSSVAESTARADRLALEVSELRAAFIQHRTATHEVAPTFCKTCRESDAVLNRPADTRGAEILAAIVEALRRYEAWLHCTDERASVAAIAEPLRALGVVGEGVL